MSRNDDSGSRIDVRSVLHVMRNWQNHAFAGKGGVYRVASSECPTEIWRRVTNITAVIRKNGPKSWKFVYGGRHFLRVDGKHLVMLDYRITSANKGSAPNHNTSRSFWGIIAECQCRVTIHVLDKAQVLGGRKRVGRVTSRHMNSCSHLHEDLHERGEVDLCMYGASGDKLSSQVTWWL
jgi:hypothetical protein